MTAKKTRRSPKLDTLIDDIKDEIDTLHDIKSTKQRLDAAKDLIEYIQLHYVE